MNKFSFKTQTLQGKFNFLTFTPIIIILIIGSASYVLFDFFKNINSTTYKINELEVVINNISLHEKNFLLYDRNNITFHQTNESENKENFTNQINNAKILIAELQNTPLIKFQKLQNSLNSLERNLELEKKSFHSLVSEILVRGNQNYGILGELNIAATTLERNSSEVSDNKFHRKLSELRISEMAYLQTGEIRYFNSNEIIINELTDILKINSTEIENFQILPINEKLIQNLISYKSAFNKLSEIDRKIGFFQVDGLVAELMILSEKNKLSIKEIILGNFNFQQNYLQKFLLLSLALIIIIGAFFFFFIKSMNRSFFQTIITIKNHITNLSNGNLPQNVNLFLLGEMLELEGSLNSLTDNLRNTKQFVNEVGKGNLETEINIFNNKGELGEALLNMRQQLQLISQEREKQLVEEKQRTWNSQGLALFSDILRRNSVNITEMGYEIISNMVKYLNANQGGILGYKLEDEDSENLYLLASYAYDRRKYTKKIITIGEGIVGTCAIEKQTVVLSEIPDNYIEITSALGKSKPKSLLVIPLHIKEQLFGVIEIASFHTFKDFEIEFVEKIAESIAATFSTVKINAKTAKLLQQSQLQAEELVAKEEEMRQNMEELQTTQEEAARKELIATGFVNSVNHTIIRADYLLDGTLDYANTKFLDLVKYKMREIRGTHISMIMDEEEYKFFSPLWMRVISGGKHIEKEIRFKTKEGHRWALATYTPVKDNDGNVMKILFLGIDIEEQKNLNLQYESEVNAINKSIIKIEFSVEGNILAANKMFFNTLSYQQKDIEEKDIFALLSQKNLSRFRSQWNEVTHGAIHELEQIFLSINNSLHWFHGTYYSLRNFDNQIYKIIYIGYDISEQKRMEDDAVKRSKELQQKEEELRINLEEMKKVQEVMKLKNEQLTELNKKAKQSEQDLQQALLQAKNAQLEIEEKNEILQSTDEELRQNIEELITIQEEMANKQEELLRTNKKLSQTEEVLKKALKKATEKEAEIISINNELKEREKELSENIMEMEAVQEEMVYKDQMMQAQMNAINYTNALAEYEIDGELITANELFCLLFGYDDMEIIGKNHRLFVLPDDRNSLFYKNFWKRISNGETLENDFRYYSKNQSVLFLKSIYTPIYDSEGKPYKVLALSINITQNKLQELELRGQLEAIRKNNIVVEMQLDGTISSVNMMFVEKFKYSENEIVGNNHKILLEKEIRKSEEYKLYWKNLQNGILIESKAKFIDKNGSLIYLNSTSYPIFDIQNKPIKIIMLATDTSEIYYQQQKLQQQADELLENKKKLTQNIEELKKIQEEMTKQQQLLKNEIERANTTEEILKRSVESHNDVKKKLQKKIYNLEDELIKKDNLIKELQQKLKN